MSQFLKLDRSKQTSALGKRFKLVPHLERLIEEAEMHWSAEFVPKLGDDAWHPSSDCTPSLHDLWLKASGQGSTRKHSGALMKTFMVGHFWHAWIQHMVADRLEFCTTEEIERRGTVTWGEGPYHWATGAGDIAPCRIPRHGDYLVDIKTMGASQFRTKGLPGWAAHKYEAQINIYMDFFDLERAIILCVCKDSPHDFKEFEFRRNQDLVDGIYTKWKLVAECLDEGIDIPEDEDIELAFTGPLL